MRVSCNRKIVAHMELLDNPPKPSSPISCDKTQAWIEDRFLPVQSRAWSAQHRLRAKPAAAQSTSARLRNIQHPLAITMWDFSWLERRWPGAGYDDWDLALDGLRPARLRRRSH